jgi:hypothetical protein
MPEYLSAKRPVHAGVRPTACAVCHTQGAWKPSVFNHPWALEGAHASASCNECHLGQPPRYAGTSRLCFDCHRDDYARSTFSGHSSFPTTCADCHSSTAWTPARAPGSKPTAHEPARERAAVPAPAPQPTAPTEAPAAVHPDDRFPISHGAHAGIGCRTCHDQGGPIGKDNTDCVQCHARAKFDRIHDGVRGYPEGTAPPNFCLRCHASGRVGG